MQTHQGNARSPRLKQESRTGDWQDKSLSCLWKCLQGSRNRKLRPLLLKPLFEHTDTCSRLRRRTTFLWSSCPHQMTILLFKICQMEFWPNESTCCSWTIKPLTASVTDSTICSSHLLVLSKKLNKGERQFNRQSFTKTIKKTICVWLTFKFST